MATFSRKGKTHALGRGRLPFRSASAAPWLRAIDAPLRPKIRSATSMPIFAKSFAVPLLAFLVAAPGEPSPASGDVPAAVLSTLTRRFVDDAPPLVRGLVIKPDRRMAGFVACGEVGAKDASRYQRFFVTVPGGLAVLESDDRELLARYWQLNGC
jgi:hypothetical protein